MFGYVIPMTDELSDGEQQLFKSYYCGVCHEMGFVGRMFLQYDCAFFALMLCHARPVECGGRCCAAPWRKRPAVRNDTVAYCADLNVILAYYKLLDDIKDEGGIKPRFLKLLLHHDYRRACRRSPIIAESVGRSIRTLTELEKEKCPVSDMAADTMAYMLRELTGCPQEPLGEMFYHIGRWLYLIDAMADYDKDEKSGAYNVLRLEWPNKEKAVEAMEFALWHTLSVVESASEKIELSDEGRKIVQNVLYRAMSAHTETALHGRNDVGSV